MNASCFLRRFALLALGVVVAGCSSTPDTPARRDNGRSGGYYLDDGPGDRSAAELERIPDAVPRAEPLHRFANRTYVALGDSYTPQTGFDPYDAEGLASWYGKRFHGRKTASGERYDMYAMTAAHPTLPIPSYVRVTALDSGKSVVVRVNDRGPFHSKRLIDLSYAAAHKLGVTLRGTLRVRVERVFDAEDAVADGAAAEDFAAADSPAGDSAAGDTAGDMAEDTPGTPQSSPDAGFTARAAGGTMLQIGAFSQRANAEALARRVRDRLALATTQVGVHEMGAVYRVLLGPWATTQETLQMADRLRERMGLEAVLKRPEPAMERY